MQGPRHRIVLPRPKLANNPLTFHRIIFTALSGDELKVKSPKVALTREGVSENLRYAGPLPS